MPHEDGSRTAIEVPGLGRGYLISMPYADKDNFVFKIPYENRVEHEAWRKAFDKMLDVVNGHVAGIHEHYRVNHG